MLPKKRRRRALAIVAAVVGLLIVALAVATLIFRRELAPIIVARASRSINGTVTIRRAAITAGGVVVLEGVSVTAPDETQPILSAPKVLVYPSLFPRKRLTVDMQSPTLNAIRTEKGALNLLKILKPVEKTGMWDVEIKASHLTIYLRDRAGIPNSIYAPYLSADGRSVRLDKRTAYVDLARTLARIGLPAEGVPPPARRPFRYDAKLTDGSLDVNFSASAASLTGSITAKLPDGGTIELRSHKMRNLGKSLKTLNLEYNLDIRVASSRFSTFNPYLNAYLPFLAQAGFDGDVKRFDANLSREEGKKQRAKYKLVAANCTGTLHRTVVLSDLGGSAEFDTTRPMFSLNLSAKLAARPVSVSYSVDYAKRSMLSSVSTKGLPLESVKPFLSEMSRVPVTGFIDADVSARGGFGALRASGNVHVSDLAVSKRLIGDVRARFDASPTGGRITELSVVGDGYSVSGRGSLTSLSSGAIDFTAACRDIAKLGFLAKTKRLPMTGGFSASGNISFKSGSYRVTAQLTSPKLMLGGRTATDVKASVALTPTVLTVSSLSAIVDGSLSKSKHDVPVAVSLSGTVGMPYSSASPISMSGTAQWSGSSAALAASIAGTGTPTHLRIAANVSGKAGVIPVTGAVTADVTNAGVSGTASGKVSTASVSSTFKSAAGGVKGTVDASGIDPSQLWPDSGVSAQAQAHATFSYADDRTSLSGDITAPNLTLEGAEQAPLENVRASADYDGATLVLKKLVATLAGNDISLSGRISKNRIDVKGGQEKFSIAGLKTALNRTGEWDGTGALSIIADGTPSAPDVKIAFSTGSGHAEGASFDSAVVDVTVRRPAHKAPIEVDVNEASVASGRGKLSLQGTVTAGKGGKAALTATAKDFPAAILAPFAHVSPDAHFSGSVNATVDIGGSLGALSPAGKVVVTDASVYDTPIQSATLVFKAEGEATRIESFEAYNEDTIVRASGVISHDPAKTLLNVEAPSINLELFTPFLKSYPRLAGDAEVQVRVTSEGGQPHMVGSVIVNNASFGGLKFRSVLGRFKFGGKVLELSDMTLKPEPLPGREEESIVLNGTLPVAQETAPMDFRIRAERLDATYLAVIFPKTLLNVGGILSADLSLTGTRQHPLLNGTVSLSSGSSSFSSLFGVENVTGTLRFSDNKFTVENVNVGQLPASASREAPAPPPRVTVSGGGEITLFPFRLIDAQMQMHMKGVENVVLGNLYSGPVDGDLAFAKIPGENAYTLKGDLVLKSGGVINLAAPMGEVLTLRGPVAFDVNVSIPDPVETRYRPIDLRALIYGNLHMGGTPGNVELDGSVLADKGSLLLFSHVLRLTERTTISFTSATGLVPFIRGRAAVVLPNSVIEPASTGGEVRQDLTVYFDFNDLATSLDSVRLSSDPPRSPEFLRQALGGQVFTPMLSTPFAQQAREQIVSFSTERLSRLLEESLKLERFDVHLENQSTLVVNIEKKVDRNLFVTYSRNFFTDINRQEIFGIKYKIGTRKLLNGYVEFKFDRAEPSSVGNEVNVQVTRRF